MRSRAQRKHTKDLNEKIRAHYASASEGVPAEPLPPVPASGTGSNANPKLPSSSQDKPLLTRGTALKHLEEALAALDRSRLEFGTLQQSHIECLLDRATLQAQAKSQEDTIAILQAKLTAVERDLQDWKHAHEGLAVRSKRNEAKFYNERKRSHRAQISKATLQNRVKILSTDLQEAQQDSRQLQHNIEAITLDLDAARADAEAFRLSLAGYQGMHGELLVARSQANMAILDATSARQELALAQAQLNHTHTEATHAISAARAEVTEQSFARQTAEAAVQTANVRTVKIRANMERARRKISALKMQIHRSPLVMNQVLKTKRKDARSRKNIYKMRHKGIYGSDMRALARTLVNAGCSQEHVGEVIQDVSKTLGIDVDTKMSRRTVKRCLLEGGIAAKVQLGFEISQAQSLTVSGDGTSHRHINYESRHTALMAPDSYSNPDSTTRPHNRLVGVHSSVNHTSEMQLQGWKETMQDILDVYNRSPLAQECSVSLALGDFTKKLCGMNSDHAEDQKKLSRLLQGWKKENSWDALGNEFLLSRSPEELGQILLDANNAKLAAVGGLEAWNSLTPEEREAQDSQMMQELARRLGQEAYATLTPEEARKLDFYLWAGCCMHKELNSVKGGNVAMMAWWSTNNIPGPVLLANKDNAATLGLGGVAAASEASSAAELRAFETSTAGAVKLTSLAGALFNHKDDKKGQQDTHRDYFKQVTGSSRCFPDTSNTRYHSHCDAAAELLTYLDHYIQFLEYIRDKKEKQNFNHMEANVHKALQDLPTRTELAVLVLYSQCITHPYALAVRGPGTERLNILDLGPLHDKLKDHIRKLRDTPALVLSPDADFREATLDGREWQWPEAISAVHRYLPDMPHLESLFVAFLDGTLTVWERFTAEFSEGGSIDTATTLERVQAWMPSTNDANEGALGALRLYLRNNPSSSLHLYNAIAMFRRNGTQDFMAAKLQGPEHEEFLRKEARLLDSGGVESSRRAAIVQAEQQLVEAKRVKARERKEKKEREAKELANKLASVELILDADVLKQCKGSALRDQLEKMRVDFQDKLIPKKSHIPKNADMLKVLLDAIPRYRKLLGLDGPSTETDSGTAEALAPVELHTVEAADDASDVE